MNKLVLVLFSLTLTIQAQRISQTDIRRAGGSGGSSTNIPGTVTAVPPITANYYPKADSSGTNLVVGSISSASTTNLNNTGNFIGNGITVTNGATVGGSLTLTATGGAKQFLKQLSAAGAVTAATISADELPTSVVTAFANPSATIGNTAVNGSSTNAMRADAAPALPTRLARVGTSATISGTDIDWSLGDFRYKTLSADTTFTFSNVVEGEVLTVKLLNTASNYVVTWPTVSWPGSITPTQTVGAKYDIYTFIAVDGGAVAGTVVQVFQ